MKTSDSVSSIYPALIDCWKEFPNLKPEGNGYNYQYVELNKVVDIAKDILPKHGLAAIQFPESNDSENIGVTTRVIHSSGEWIEGTVYAHPTNMKGVNQTQATGATITYLRRYGLICVLGATGDKDTDGRADNEPRIDNVKINKYEKILRGALSLEALVSAWKGVYQDCDKSEREILTKVKDEMKAKLS